MSGEVILAKSESLRWYYQILVNKMRKYRHLTVRGGTNLLAYETLPRGDYTMNMTVTVYSHLDGPVHHFM